MPRGVYERKPESRLALRQRFWSKVITGSDCWEWQAACDGGGYGVFRINGRQDLAHRVAYEFVIGPIPDGLTIDHLCRNRACVNPEHLEVVTGRENTLRGNNPAAQNARKTHCPRGHPLFGDNLYRDSKSRCCRTCRRENQRLRRAKGSRE